MALTSGIITDITSFKPIGKNILVLPTEEAEVKTAGGIIMVDGTQDTRHRVIKSKVVAVSRQLEHLIKPGEYVHYQKMYELSISINKQRHVILKEEHIIAVSED